MTQFRVLPTWRGDAYLLKSSRGSYLVDGGDTSGDLPRMLHERRVGKLRGAVCTFPSPERLNGILDLLEAGYPVGECWLPALLDRVRRMAMCFDNDWSGWLSLFGWDSGQRSLPSPPFLSDRENPMAGVAILVLLVMGGRFGEFPEWTSAATPSDIIVMALDALICRGASRWSDEVGGVGRLMRDTGMRVLRGGGVRELAILCCNLLLAELETMSGDSGHVLTLRSLVLSALAGILAVDGSVRVRFFSRSGELVQNLVPHHPFICLNGGECDREMLSGPVSPGELFREGKRFSGNGRGLVFQFGDGKCNVLFCSDSKMDFVTRTAPFILTQPTVVTAPKHGGVASDEAYERITSGCPARDIWVRTHSSYAKKVSDAFKEQKNKFCLNNCVHRTVQEALFEFSNGRWNVLAGGSCICG